jgi:hypothetical protein
MAVTQPPRGAIPRDSPAGRIQNKWKKLQSGTTLSAAEVAQFWVDAGGNPKDASLASAISAHESGRVVGKYNGICCYGLMQINADAHGSRYASQAPGAEWDRMRKAVSLRRGAGKCWGPGTWEVCHDCKCSNLQAEADAIQTGNLGGQRGIPNPLDLVPDPLADIGRALIGIAESIINILTKLADPETWLNILKIIAGAVLLYMAFKRLFHITT